MKVLTTVDSSFSGHIYALFQKLKTHPPPPRYKLEEEQCNIAMQTSPEVVKIKGSISIPVDPAQNFAHLHLYKW